MTETNETATNTKKPLWKRWWVIAIGAFILIGIIGSAASSGDKSNQSGSDTASTTAATSGGNQPSTTTGAPTTTKAKNSVDGPFDAIEKDSFSGETSSIGSFTIQGRSCGFIDGDSCWYVRLTPSKDCKDGLSFDAPAVINGTPVDNVSDVASGGYAGQEVTFKVSAKDKGASLDPARATWSCLEL